MNYYCKICIIVCISLLSQSCRRNNHINDINSHFYRRADVIYEYFCVLRNYAETEYDMLARKEKYRSMGQILEITSDSTLAAFSVKIDSVRNNSSPVKKQWVKNAYVVAVFEGDGIRDTVAIDRFKVPGVYINGTCYEDSTLFKSLTELLDPAVLYSIPE